MNKEISAPRHSVVPNGFEQVTPLQLGVTLYRTLRDTGRWPPPATSVLVQARGCRAHFAGRSGEAHLHRLPNSQREQTDQPPA